MIQLAGYGRITPFSPDDFAKRRRENNSLADQVDTFLPGPPFTKRPVVTNRPRRGVRNFHSAALPSDPADGSVEKWMQIPNLHNEERRKKFRHLPPGWPSGSRTIASFRLDSGRICLNFFGVNQSTRWLERTQQLTWQWQLQLWANSTQTKCSNVSRKKWPVREREGSTRANVSRPRRPAALYSNPKVGGLPPTTTGPSSVLRWRHQSGRWPQATPTASRLLAGNSFFKKYFCRFPSLVGG